MPLNHLLIFTPGFPSSEHETTCLPAVQQFVKCYRETYPELIISVISLHYPFTTTGYKWNNVDVYPTNGRNKTGIKRGITILKAIRKARQINKDKNVDAVLCFWLTDAALAGKRFANKTNIPYLAWMHGQDARPGNKYVKLVHPLKHQLAAISQFQQQIFEKTYPYQTGHIISNGITQTLFPELNISSRSIDLLAVGSLIPLKQYHLFIELVNELKNKGHKNINAVLAGEGILFDELGELIAKLKLENNIRITNKISHNAVLQLMNDARVFVHTSAYEGHSTVMLEALYSGCKVVSFIPASDDVIPNSIVCNDMDTIIETCSNLLSKQEQPSRILVNSIKDSVTTVHNILNVKKSR